MKITIQTIKDLNPYADRFKNFMAPYPDFEGTHEDFLSLEKISHEHKLWVMLRLMPRFEAEVFAIECAVSAAAYAAAYAASTAAANAAHAAYAAANAADWASYAVERERQLAAINYLINKSEELNERI